MQKLSETQLNFISGGTRSSIANTPLADITLSQLFEELYSWSKSSVDDMVSSYPWISDYIERDDDGTLTINL